MIEPQGIGYVTLVNQLVQVHDLLGIKCLAAILDHHGSATVKGLHPSKWPRVIAHCQFAVVSAKSWEWMLATKEHVSPAAVARGGTVLFNKAVDRWFDACEHELRLTRPDLYERRKAK